MTLMQIIVGCERIEDLECFGRAFFGDARLGMLVDPDLCERERIDMDALPRDFPHVIDCLDRDAVSAVEVRQLNDRVVGHVVESHSNARARSIFDETHAHGEVLGHLMADRSCEFDPCRDIASDDLRDKLSDGCIRLHVACLLRYL